MADPVIVPPAPTVNQGQPIPSAAPQGEVDTSPGIEVVQKVFDKVFPEIKTSPTKEVPKPATEPVDQPKEPETRHAVQPEQPVTEKTPDKEVTPEHAPIPSFLEEALRGDVTSGRAAVKEEDEWPEELPAFKTPEETKSRYKKWRESYNGLKKELEVARTQPRGDPQAQQKLSFLEHQNRQMAEQLTRLGVQHSAEFQQQVMAPLQAHWNEAARIVRDAGGDPQELAKAMSLSGKAQFEALDGIFNDMPESARTEAHDALRNYRRYEEIRKRAIADSPRTLEALRKQETQRQYAEVSKAREDMKVLFDSALRRLRDEAKVEVFQRSDNPGDKWWNEQGDRVIEAARNLYMENTDMDKVAFACLLAPTADVYRKLFHGSQKEVVKLRKIINDRLGGEPTLSESPGASGEILPERQLQEDLKRPFNEVFLREFHRAQARSR